jgi:hypothetical protein
MIKSVSFITDEGLDCYDGCEVVELKAHAKIIQK